MKRAESRVIELEEDCRSSESNMTFNLYEDLCIFGNKGLWGAEKTTRECGSGIIFC